VTVDRVTDFEADIAASADSLADSLAAWGSAIHPIAAGRRICFAGLGSSRYAAMVVAGDLRARGRTAWVEHAGGGTAPADDLVFVAISSSGRTPEVVEAARAHRSMSQVIAVTNRPDSPLAAVADRVVSLGAGEETSGIACRTFRATIAALALLGGTDPADLDDVPAGLAERQAAAARSRVAEAAGALDHAPAIDVLAPSPLLGIAEQAALVLREAPRLPAHAFESADWLHVGVYQAWPGHRILRFVGSPADAEIDAVAARRGVEVVDIAPVGPTSRPLAEAIVRSIDAECLALELWHRTSVDKEP
jgi:fructoselysine-6-P-deglycase FrlB-like protein